MSNLQLPTMTRDALLELLPSTAPKTIAYATTAELVIGGAPSAADDYVVIRHHGNKIAELGHNWIYVTNAGYDSSTTRQRLHKILVDNTHSGSLLLDTLHMFGLKQHKHEQVLFIRDNERDTDVRVTLKDDAFTSPASPHGRDFHEATLTVIDGRWVLRTYNGVDTPAFEAALTR